MTILKFEGVLRWVFPPIDESSPTIIVGDRNLIREIQAADFEGEVTFAVGDNRFRGDWLAAFEGSPGYSEWTPMEPVELYFSDERGWRAEHDLVKELHPLRGQHVAIWIADEPVNILEEE